MSYSSETSLKRIWLLLLLIAPCELAAATALAQSPTPSSEPTGSVTGHVFCSDTNQPARFAHVSLEPIPAAAASPASKPSPHTPSDSVSTTSVETTLDGSFALTKVKPGAYYVVVEKQGYVKPRDIFTKKQIDDPSPEMRALIASALPRVTVEGGHTDQAEVRLERGAALSGTLLYDDGSPAGELGIQLLHKDASGKWVPVKNSSSFNLRTQTDDRGFFRIASLLGDEYKVEADLRLSQSKTVTQPGANDGNIMQFVMQSDFFTLSFYGTGTPLVDDAKPVKLLAGQELTGQDMMLPISKLHKLTGRVAAGPDAHLVNAANVALFTRVDNKQLATSEISRDDGLFHFEFVPDGDYILRVTDARDVVWEAPTPASTSMPMPFPAQDKERVLATYGNVDQPLILSGEMLGVTATIPPDTKPSPATSTPAQN